MPNKNTKLTEGKLIRAAIATHGNKTRCSQLFHVSRQAVTKFASTHPEVAAAFDEAAESMLDLAETKLYAAMKAGKPWAVCFTLKTQGWKRGWVERHPLTGEDGGAVEIRVTYAEKPHAEG